MTAPRAGWYPDPAGAPFDRWWNGHGWTPFTQPLGLADYQRRMARSARATGALARLVLWTVAFVVAIIVLVALAAAVVTFRA